MPDVGRFRKREREEPLFPAQRCEGIERAKLRFVLEDGAFVREN
jgi:hypothetical protein